MCSWSAAAIPANDCVGACLRQGCRSVAQLEMLPAPPIRRAKGNPWPEWPRVLRTDYGQMEAIAVQGGDPRLFETTVERVLADENGNVRAVETVRVARGTDGRLRPVDGTRRTLPCQLYSSPPASSAANRRPPSASAFIPERPQPPRPSRRRHTLAPGLFVAGDMRTGQSLVVRALADGRAAAMEAQPLARRGGTLRSRGIQRSQSLANECFDKRKAPKTQCFRGSACQRSPFARKRRGFFDRQDREKKEIR